jgi:hypothetical protein
VISTLKTIYSIRITSITDLNLFNAWLKEQNDRLVELNKAFPPNNKLKLFYRGVSNSVYTNLPSIYRRNILIRKEDFIVKECMRHAPHEFSQEKYTFDELVKLQHYGLPTRLLDLTTNPYVALFFAVHPYKQKPPCMDEVDQQIASLDHAQLHQYVLENFTRYGIRTGKIFAIFVSEKAQKFSDSDTISIISNISKRPCAQFGDYLDYYEEFLKKCLAISNSSPHFNDERKQIERDFIEDVNTHTNISYLLHEIKHEKTYFSDIINVEDMLSIWYVSPNLNNNRIVRQDGAFLIYGISGEKTVSLTLPSIQNLDELKEFVDIRSELFFNEFSYEKYLSYLDKLEEIFLSISSLMSISPINELDATFLRDEVYFENFKESRWNIFLFKVEKLVVLIRLHLIIKSVGLANRIYDLDRKSIDSKDVRNDLTEVQDYIAKLGLLHGLLTDENIIFTDDVEVTEKEILSNGLSNMGITYGKLFPELDDISEFLTDQVMLDSD